MSFKASDYAWRLRVHNKSTPRKMMLVRIAAMVSDDSMSCYAKTGTFAAYLDIDGRNAKAYISDLVRDGHISVLDRTHPDGQQRESRFFIHGPWDAFGGTGIPFEEIELPKSSKPLDPTPAIDVTPEARAELRRRFNEYAEEFGNFPDGTPRCRWRLGCRAHSIVCWYGVGNTVVHDGRPARVTSITDTGPRNKPIPEQVTLDYLDDEGGTAEGVLVEALSEPTGETTPRPKPEKPEPQKPRSERGGGITTPGVAKSPPHGVAKSPSHGVAKSPSLESSSEAKRESSSSEGTGRGLHRRKEEEESPTATTNGSPSVTLIQSLTDATTEEAAELVEIIRPKVKYTLSGLIRSMAENDDLGQELWKLRRQRAPQPRPGASKGGHRRCSLPAHGELTPCGSCKADLRLGGEARQAVVDMYLSLGPDAPQLRPDLAANPVIAGLVAA